MILSKSVGLDVSRILCVKFFMPVHLDITVTVYFMLDFTKKAHMRKGEFICENELIFNIGNGEELFVRILLFSVFGSEAFVSIGIGKIERFIEKRVKFFTKLI